MFFCENQILNQKWIIIFVFQPDPIRTSVYRSKKEDCILVYIMQIRNI